jgi:hypothetical protein
MGEFDEGLRPLDQGLNAVISKPTTPQLLATIKAELNDKIAPALSDPTHVVAIQMMSAMLDALSVRTEHELAWMRDECAAIEGAAADYVAAHPAATAVASALAAYRDNVTTSLRLSETQADYERASDLLSVLSEAAFAGGEPTSVRAVEGLIESRLATEMAIVGTFVAAGRE